MEMMIYFLFALLVGFSLTLDVAHAQDDQTGFISIDCGLPEGSDYTDANTGLFYISDTSYTQSGLANTISPIYQTNSLSKQFLTVRSFPRGTKNCYTLKPPQGKGNKYLIRASFLYGNYDNKTQLPNFNLQFGVEDWVTVAIEDASTSVRTEIIHIPTSDYIHVCLVKTGLSTPFISALELRLLNTTNTVYTSRSGSLQLYTRINFYSIADFIIRYKADVYDRIWRSFVFPGTTVLTTSSEILQNSFLVPTTVMSNAIAPDDTSNPLAFYWATNNMSNQYYVYMHFAEVQPNQSRELDIYLNGELWYGPLQPAYLSTTTVYSATPLSGSLTYEVSINKTQNSTLPPIINALEIYSVKEFLHMGTNDTDVSAVLSIKSVYELRRDWQGDPCAPKAFVWEGLNCSYNGFQSPRITALNLSSSGLNGVIAPYLSNLTELQSLDLSGNKLTGPVPGFLSEMSSLKVLYLDRNNFTGPIPTPLLQKSNNGSLSLRY